MTRTSTPDRYNDDGSRTITVKRACNGCHRLIGDLTEEEAEAAMNGEALPDVTLECGCAIVDAWTDQDTGIVWLCGLGRHHDCEGYACPCACHALTPELCDVLNEKARAEEKFGLQLDVPDVVQVLVNRPGGVSVQRMAEEYGIPTAARAKYRTDVAFDRSRRQGTWGHILVEEVAEAIEAATVAANAANFTDCPTAGHEQLRAELIQVAAVALRWVDALDARGPVGDPSGPGATS